jgi:primosomal protein N' (replication factor Y)
VEKPPQLCTRCSSIRIEMMGVGTEKVAHAMEMLFPKARIARMDRASITNRKGLENCLRSIADRAVDVVIGTQMVAKGHDFPGIQLVGILLADASLNMPDFRAFERTFQMITQVSGRAGRGDTPGEVVIQTIKPDHPVLVAASENRSEDFYLTELRNRQQFGFPPGSRLALLIFQHRNEKRAALYAHEVVRHLIAGKSRSVSILGPAQAPLGKLKNLYRWQCLLRSSYVKDLKEMLRTASDYVSSAKIPISLVMDVDPQTLL